MNTVGRYSAVLGRAPFLEREPIGPSNVRTYGFAPLRRSFWRSLISEAHDTTIYLTSGMSDHIMPVPPPEQRMYPPRVELMAVCAGQITGGPSGKDDVVSALLATVAEHVLDSRIFIGVGHTLDFQEALAPNTEMTAFLFTPPEGVDERRLRRCTRAEAILNVVPITATELDLARRAGVPALIDRLESSGFAPAFHYTRKSAV